MFLLWGRERDAILMRSADNHNTDKNTVILSGLRGYGKRPVIYIVSAQQLIEC